MICSECGKREVAKGDDLCRPCLDADVARIMAEIGKEELAVYREQFNEQHRTAMSKATAEIAAKRDG